MPGSLSLRDAYAKLRLEIFRKLAATAGSTLASHHINELHHAEIFMIKRMAMPHILARKVLEAHAKGNATLRWHRQGVGPKRRNTLAVDFDHIAVVDMNMKRVGVIVEAIDRLLFDRIESNGLGCGQRRLKRRKLGRRAGVA